MIFWAVWLTASLVLFSGDFCETHDELFSGNLRDRENTLLVDEYAGLESQAAIRRVLRAVPTGWVNITPSSLYLVKGESGSVVCSGDISDLVWLDASNKALKASGNLKMETDKNKNQTKLTFSSVKEKQKGLYICLNQKSNRSANFTLTVYEKPKPKITTSTKSYDAGDRFNLTCQGNSPNISWFSSSGLQILSYASAADNSLFTGKVTPTGTKDKYTLDLTFTNATKAQTGEYKCTVKVLNKEKSASISIQIASTTLKFSPDQVEASVMENKDYSIACSGKFSQVWWTHLGKNVDYRHEGDESVYVENVKPSEQKLVFAGVEKFNEGQYICNGIATFNGHVYQKAFVLKVTEDNVLDDPIIRSRRPRLSDNVAKVQIYDNFTVACISETTKVEWLSPMPHLYTITSQEGIPGKTVYTETIPLFKNRLLLRFKNVTLSEEGQYSCRVTKSDKTRQAVFNLTVIIPIAFGNTPSHYTVNETGDIKLECVVTGKPMPVVTWYTHDNRPINDGEAGFSYDGTSLMMKNVSYHQAGKYICKAVQSSIEGSSRERAVSLEVFHKPYFFAPNVTTERMKNQTSSLKCKADADPPARYTWYRNDSIVTTASGVLANDLENGTIQVPLLNNTDYEIFICNATNSFGWSSVTVNVTVMQVPPAPIVKVLMANESEVEFQITADRNESIIEFNIEYREKSSNDWNEKNETKPDTFLHPYVFALDDLHSKTEYVIRARSINPIGAGEFSKEVEFKTSLANQLTASMGVLFAVILTLYNFEFL